LTWYDEADPCRHIVVNKPSINLWADVGFYYLPHVERIWETLPDVRFVCLKRDREETIQSFESYLRDDQCHWRKRRAPQWQPSVWDACFPNIDAGSRPEAIGIYWDEYYAAAESLERDDRFQIFPTQCLNTREGVKSILEFIGVQEPVVRLGIWLHKSADRYKGIEQWFMPRPIEREQYETVARLGRDSAPL
jgi:hypothetical protein